MHCPGLTFKSVFYLLVLSLYRPYGKAAHTSDYTLWFTLVHSKVTWCLVGVTNDPLAT